MELPLGSPSKSVVGKTTGYSTGFQYSDIDTSMNKDPAVVNVDNVVKSMFFQHQTPRAIRFFMIVTGVFVFFAGHNFMQEFIMSMPGFSVRTAYSVSYKLSLLWTCIVVTSFEMCLCRLVFTLVTWKWLVLHFSHSWSVSTQATCR